MSKLIGLAIAAAALLPLSTMPASALSASSARQICIKAAAQQHSDLQGNVQVRKVSQRGSGYEVNMQVKGVEINCMLTGSGKVRYIN